MWPQLVAVGHCLADRHRAQRPAGALTEPPGVAAAPAGGPFGAEGAAVVMAAVLTILGGSRQGTWWRRWSSADAGRRGVRRRWRELSLASSALVQPDRHSLPETTGMASSTRRAVAAHLPGRYRRTIQSHADETFV